MAMTNEKSAGFRIPVLEGILPIKASQIPLELIAGLTLAALAIPEVMGYTRISGTPVITGLYTMVLPMALFALFGSSRHLVVGADSATAAICRRRSGGVGALLAPIITWHWRACWPSWLRSFLYWRASSGWDLWRTSSHARSWSAFSPGSVYRSRLGEIFGNMPSGAAGTAPCRRSGTISSSSRGSISMHSRSLSVSWWSRWLEENIEKNSGSADSSGRRHHRQLGPRSGVACTCSRRGTRRSAAYWSACGRV